MTATPARRSLASMMTLERRYALDDDAEVLDRARALTDYWAKKHGVKVEWREREVRLFGRVLGVKFDGTVQVGDGVIRAAMSAGFLAEKLGARQYVERKLDDYLDPRNTLEALRARIPR